MNVQLQEIKNMYIKNRLTEGVDFKRYEWLKGDNTARISIIFNGYRETLDYTIQPESNSRISDRIYSTFVNISDSDVCEYQYFIGSSYELSLRHGIRRNNNSFFIDIKSGGYVGIVYNISLKRGITDNSVIFLINGSTYQKSGIFNSLLDFDASMSIYAKAAKISAFNTDRYNLTPCQLLHSIPATLDANNIARSAGECGMYDSISGKFYGNVAGSGTFTVEEEVEPETHSGLQQIYQNKLIEGVDYQTYDWLKYMNWSKPEGENSLLGAYLICNLKVTTRLKVTIKLGEIIRNINNSDIELIVSSSTRTYYIRRSYFNNNIAIYNTTSTMLSNEYNLGTELDFLITEEGLFVNDVHLINEKIEYINRFSNYGRSCTGSISSVTTEEDIDVLVPCQLLHSIPRNLDAQCKERQVGECGMIDLISGKFYGNVANSGTFTVENDNNE